MKKQFRFVLSFIGLILCNFVNAQSYDGYRDYKILLGYINLGGNSGGELQSDLGMSDLISYGAKVSIIAKPKDYAELDFGAFQLYDIGFFLRFHFSETLKLSEKIDPYLGLDVSMKALGGHVGVKYAFNDNIGLYTQVYHGFSGSLWPADGGNDYRYQNIGRNYFAKKTGLSLGLMFGF